MAMKVSVSWEAKVANGTGKDGSSNRTLSILFRLPPFFHSLKILKKTSPVCNVQFGWNYEKLTIFSIHAHALDKTKSIWYSHNVLLLVINLFSFHAFASAYYNYSMWLYKVALCHRQVIGGIPPPSRGLVGENRSTQSPRVKWGPFTCISQCYLLLVKCSLSYFPC